MDPTQKRDHTYYADHKVVIAWIHEDVTKKLFEDQLNADLQLTGKNSMNIKGENGDLTMEAVAVSYFNDSHTQSNSKIMRDGMPCWYNQANKSMSK